LPKDDWTTAVGEVAPGIINVRGYPITELIAKLSFSEAAYLTIRGELPTPPERRLMDAALCSILEHGLYAPTTLAARVVASTVPQTVIPGIAAGILTIGSITVSPQHSAELIQRVSEATGAGASRDEAAEAIAAELINARQRMPGLGHPLHPEGDPRAEVLESVARETGMWREAAQNYLAVRHAYLRRIERELPINIDGMLGCVLSELGFRPIEMPGIAALSFMPGIVAHCVEEATSPPTLRIADARYVGLPARHLDGQRPD
jgi:citrate synthase